jgi:hypothetical protein
MPKTPPALANLAAVPGAKTFAAMTVVPGLKSLASRRVCFYSLDTPDFSAGERRVDIPRFRSGFEG